MQNQKAAIWFIFLTLLIDVIGFGILIPVFPRMLSELNGITINEASTYGGLLAAVYAMAQFVFSPVIGGLSDQYGRRPVLLTSLAVFSFDYLIMAFAPNFGWLIFGRFLAGVSGASFSTASAYIADISTDENRSKNFGMIGAAFGLGFVIGPFLGGILEQYGTKIPFYVTAALSFMNLVYGYFMVPESLSVDNRRKFDLKRASPWGSFRQLFKYQDLRWLILAFLFLYLGSHAVQSTWNYFTMFRFGWDAQKVSYSLALVGVLVAIVQAGLASKAAKVLGVGRSVIVGFGLYSIGMFLFAIANQSWMMFAFLLPYCLGGIAMPNLQAYMTSKVEANQQGELQGGLTSMNSLTLIIGPLLMTSIFYIFSKPTAPFYLPGAAFVLGGIFMTISFFISWRVLK
jgi:MFS transporter, DHA1 family, tetracycline resistance protein